MTSANTTTVPGYYARRRSYQSMTDYTFLPGDFGNIAAHMLSYTPKHITPIEQSLLGKIVSRAIKYSKDNVLLPMADLTNGVKSEDIYIDTPMHSAKTTIERAMKSLVDKGLIEYFLDTKAYPYVNRVIVYVKNIKEMLGMAKLNISKKQRNTVEQNESRGVTHSESTNRSNINRGNKDKRIENSNSSSVEEIISEVKTKHRVRRKDTLSTKKKFSGKAFKEVWNASTANFFQGVGGVAENLSPREQGMAFKAFGTSPVFQDNSWAKYVDHVVSNWELYASQLLDKGYGKTKQVPLIPTFKYFLYHHKNGFYPMYIEQLKGSGMRRNRVDKTKGMQKQIDRKDTRIGQLEEENKLLQSNAIRNRKKSIISSVNLVPGFKAKRNNKKVFNDKTVQQIDDEFNSVLDLPEWDTLDRSNK